MAKSKILIIDDEENLCFLVKMNLEATGRYEVLTATDPREGLKLAKANIPDLILLDLMMPHMEGSEVAERLMDMPDTQHIPIIFLTALAEKGRVDANMGTIAGREFVAKPVTTGDLVRKIEAVLRRGPRQ